MKPSKTDDSWNPLVLKRDGHSRIAEDRWGLQVLRSQPSYTQGQIEQQIANNGLGTVDQSIPTR